MRAAPGDDDLVEGAVELAVAASVESVTDGLAGGGGDRSGSSEAGEQDLLALQVNQQLQLCSSANGCAPTPADVKGVFEHSETRMLYCAASASERRSVVESRSAYEDDTKDTSFRPDRL